MEHELSKRYSSAFRQHPLTRSLAFARDVGATGKWRELSSFVIWEVLHKLRLFPSGSYLVFSEQRPLSLAVNDLAKSSPEARIAESLAPFGLCAKECEYKWKMVVPRCDHTLLGCCYPKDNELCETDNRGTARIVRAFARPIKAIFVARSQSVFVCIKGALYRRRAGAEALERVLELSSPESFFRQNNAMTELPDGTLVLGEYGNVWNSGGWSKLAWLYSSSDDGATWTASDFLIREGTNKHVHVVRYSDLLKKLLVTDGDNRKRLWLAEPGGDARLESLKWRNTTRFHIQMGGYTSVVEADGKLMLGTDYQGGTNFLVESRDGRSFTKKIVPDPYRRSPIDNMVLRRSRNGTEIWANLPYSDPESRCLLMFSRDGGQSWNRVLEYSRSNHLVWIISSCSHVPDELYFSIQNQTTHCRVVYKVGGRQ